MVSIHSGKGSSGCYLSLGVNEGSDESCSVTQEKRECTVFVRCAALEPSGFHFWSSTKLLLWGTFSLPPPKSPEAFKSFLKIKEWIKFVEASRKGLQNDRMSDPSIMLETFCQDDHFGIGEYSGVDGVTSAPACHAGVNVTVLALRLMGNVEFTLADKCVVFPLVTFTIHLSCLLKISPQKGQRKSVLASTSIRASLHTVPPKFLRLYIKTVCM